MTTKDFLTALVNFLSKVILKLSPVMKWIYIIAIAFIAVITLSVFVACGNVTKISVSSDSPNSLSVSVHQSDDDSTGTSITVNPTVNLTPNYVKKDETPPID